MLVRSPVGERMFGQANVLVAAHRLTLMSGIYVDQTVRTIDYVHVLFDEHEIIFAEGAPSESLLLGDEAKAALSPGAPSEINLLLPGRATCAGLPSNIAVVPDGRHQNVLVQRMAQNNKRLLDSYPSSGF